MSQTPYRDRMEAKIRAGLNPQVLEIKDDSHKHAGHADRIAALSKPGQENGHAPIDGAGETHFKILIVSEAFTGQSRINRHRMVNDLVADELRERVHALQLKTLTPEEAS